MIKLLLVDDDQLVREGVQGLLQNKPEFTISGSVESGEAAFSFLNENTVDIILLDLNMPGWGGLETTKKIHKKFPKVNITILTTSKSDFLPRHLLNAGAKAYLTKDCDINEVIMALKRVYAGRGYIGNELSQQIAINIQQYDTSPFERLTTREFQVIIMILHGMKSSEIAEALSISAKTVHTHKSRAYEKLNIENDMELFRLAILHNIIEPF